MFVITIKVKPEPTRKSQAPNYVEAEAEGICTVFYEWPIGTKDSQAEDDAW